MNQLEMRFKKDGMRRAAKNRNQDLESAREMARLLARDGRPISIDDVREALPYLKPGNFMGSVFKGKEWIRHGFVPSRHSGGHCRLISTWIKKL